MPFFSVIITSYNRELYLKEAIESVIASTFNDFELLIVDDCSTDNTVEIANSYLKSDGRIKVFVNERNLGQFQNRNKAATFAKGDYIVYVDSDDKIFPDALSRFAGIISSFDDVYFGMYLYNSDLEPFQMTSEAAIRKHFFEHAFLTIGPGGTFIKRSFFKILGGYPTKYDAPGDLYFNLKVACKTNIVFLPFDFMFYRRHALQEINNPYSYLINNYGYLRDALNELPLPITNKEVKWLKNKNRRRFIINIFRFFATSRSVRKTAKALQDAKFSGRDFLLGIFH